MSKRSQKATIHKKKKKSLISLATKKMQMTITIYNKLHVCQVVWWKSINGNADTSLKQLALSHTYGKSDLGSSK